MEEVSGRKKPRCGKARKLKVDESHFLTLSCRKADTEPASVKNMRLPSSIKEETLEKLNLKKQDMYGLFFYHKKTIQAAKIFIEWLKNRGYVTRSEVSNFTRRLEAGKVYTGFKYRRSSFYRTILKRLVALGFIALQQRYDKSKDKVVYAYAPVYQPIPKRPPPSSGSFWWNAWHIAKKWNETFGF